MSLSMFATSAINWAGGPPQYLSWERIDTPKVSTGLVDTTATINVPADCTHVLYVGVNQRLIAVDGTHSMDLGGTSMTQLDTGSFAAITAQQSGVVYSLANPPTGAQTLTSTYSDKVRKIVGYAIYLTGTVTTAIGQVDEAVTTIRKPTMATTVTPNNGLTFCATFMGYANDHVITTSNTGTSLDYEYQAGTVGVANLNAMCYLTYDEVSTRTTWSTKIEFAEARSARNANCIIAVS